jgi:uncharacterized protein YigE (DUF2233 family)
MKWFVLIGAFLVTFPGRGQELMDKLFHNGNTYDVVKMEYTSAIPSNLSFIENTELLSHDEFLGGLLLTDPAFFLVNACISDAECKPMGLYVVDGRVLNGINSDDGEGNFYLKPNGALLLMNNRVVICETADISRHGQVIHGIQSGPMLVVDNRIHPGFTPNSANKHLRVGVGVSTNRQGQEFLQFAISNEPVNFFDFADFFKNKLGCENALVLESQGCSMYYEGRSSENMFYTGKICRYIMMKM